MNGLTRFPLFQSTIWRNQGHGNGLGIISGKRMQRRNELAPCASECNGDESDQKVIKKWWPGTGVTKKVIKNWLKSTGPKPGSQQMIKKWSKGDDPKPGSQQMIKKWSKGDSPKPGSQKSDQKVITEWWPETGVTTNDQKVVVLAIPCYDKRRMTVPC